MQEKKVTHYFCEAVNKNYIRSCNDSHYDVINKWEADLVFERNEGKRRVFLIK